MKIKHKTGGFTQTFHAVFDAGVQITHWARSKDRTLAAFWRSNLGKDFRAGRIAKDSRRFSIQTKSFFTPAKELPVAA